MQRQERYRKSGVRGLWFVRTRKPFPADERLPVFNVHSAGDQRKVSLERQGDWPDSWPEGPASAEVELGSFIRSALHKELAWAPYTQANASTLCEARMYLNTIGQCSSCTRRLGRPYSVAFRLVMDSYYPRFVWHQAMGRRRRSAWAKELAQVVQGQSSVSSDTAITDETGTVCLACGGLARKAPPNASGCSVMTSQLRLSDLSTPRYGSLEWDWLYRWALRCER